MPDIETIFRAIPQAATSPLALLAYISALIAWITFGVWVWPLNTLLGKIKTEQLSSKDARDLILARIGEPVPPDLAPNEFLRYKRQKYLFLGVLVLIAVAVLLVGISLSYAMRRDAQVRIDRITIDSIPKEYLAKHIVPVGAQFPVVMSDVPSNATVTWDVPKCGELTPLLGSSPTYSTKKLGDESLRAVIQFNLWSFNRSVDFKIVGFIDE